MNRFVGVLAGFALLPTAVLASDSGKLSWVVWQCDLHDFSGRSDKIIADFRSENEAGEFAKERYLGDNGSYFYVPTERTEHQQTTSQQDLELITVPYPVIAPLLPPFVDPPLLAPCLGPDVYKSFEPDADQSYLENRSGHGRIGQYAVRVEFHRGNKFLFTGGVSIDGTWEEREGGEVLLTTDNSYFRGNIVHSHFYPIPFYHPDVIVSGLSWPFDDLQPPQEFRLTIRAKQKIAGKLYYTTSSAWYAPRDDASATPQRVRGGPRRRTAEGE
jgi:hypothetical protein